ncbi:unnamed protein product, partial [Phaeothamnion confervicola]
ILLLTKKGFRSLSSSELLSSGSHRKMHLPGRLFVYDPPKNLVAFETAPRFRRHVVFVGGLTDGFLCTPYVAPLAHLCEELGWNFVQPLLRSSYVGFGTASLTTDAEDIDSLLGALCGDASDGGYSSGSGGGNGDGGSGGSKGDGESSCDCWGGSSTNASPAMMHPEANVVLVGHSTGCQDAVTYLRLGRHRALIRGVVLQAPTSDREEAAPRPETAGLVAAARAMRDAGRAEELMPRAAGPAPITASRFLSLAAGEGDDDLFSSDFDAGRMAALLGHVMVPTLVLFSGADQYVPPAVDKLRLVAALAAAMPGAAGRGVLVEGADHAMTGHIGE